jgi:hypothetical protein
MALFAATGGITLDPVTGQRPEPRMDGDCLEAARHVLVARSGDPVPREIPDQRPHTSNALPAGFEGYPQVQPGLRDRRDPVTRAQRYAVAAWFGVHPAALASLDTRTIEHMATRLEGRTAHRRCSDDGMSAVPHPWAG